MWGTQVQSWQSEQATTQSVLRTLAQPLFGGLGLTPLTPLPDPPHPYRHAHIHTSGRYLILKCGSHQTEDQRSPAEPKAMLVTRSPNPNSDWDSLLDQTMPAAKNVDHNDQKIKEETGTKEQSTHSTKTNSEIGIWNCIHPKHRCLDSRVRT